MKYQLFFFSLILTFSSCTGNIRTDTRDRALRDAAKNLRAIDKETPIKKVALLGFDVIGDSQRDYGSYITEKLTHELVKRGHYSVVERRKIDKIIKEQNLWQSGIINLDSALRIGRILAVDSIILGTLRIQGDRVELLAKLVNSQSGLISKSISVSFRDRSALAPGSRYSQVQVSEGTAGGRSKVSIPPEEQPLAELLHVSLFRSGRSMVCMGEIKNTGKIDIAKARIGFKLIDSRGNLITLINAFTDRHIKPGETLPFSGFMKNAPGTYSHYEIVYEPEPVQFFTYYTNLKSSQEKFRKERFSGYRLTGIIRNLNGIKIQYPHIIVSLYNKKGEFIGKAGGYATRRRLKQGESSPYSVQIYGIFLKSKPESYRLNFSSLKDMNP
jgi:TolB-like protein